MWYAHVYDGTCIRSWVRTLYGHPRRFSGRLERSLRDVDLVAMKSTVGACKEFTTVVRRSYGVVVGR